MRINTCALFLIPLALLLAKTEPVGSHFIEIKTSNGTVIVVGSDVDQVRLDDPSRATIHTENGKTVVSPVDPSGLPVRVEIPRRSALHAVTSNGAIRISGVSGPLNVVTSNGTIVVEDAGSSEIHAHTSNGAIDIGLAPRSSAKISAHTSNGHIQSDFPVVSQQRGTDYLQGQIGSGGPLLDLTTSNGVIRIRGAEIPKEYVTSNFTPGEVK
jgi:DUF4097 and DUF4098 domain-containing protein YvlB